MNHEPEPDGSRVEQKSTKALRKKQQREDRQREREQARLAAQRKKLVRRVLLWSIPVILSALGVWAIARSPKTSNEDNPIISRRGIHWHPNLEIWIKGERVTIPANIGLGAVHSDTHTHRENDQIHLEMNRPVRESDTRLGVFFDVWGKGFNSQCILDVCNGEEGTIKMLVNGEENFEFENYKMKDGDKIEIRYE